MIPTSLVGSWYLQRQRSVGYNFDEMASDPKRRTLYVLRELTPDKGTEGCGAVMMRKADVDMTDLQDMPEAECQEPGPSCEHSNDEQLPASAL